MTKTIGKIVISQLVSFVVFLVLLGVANYLIAYIDSPNYSQVVNFLLDNLWISVIIFLIGIAR